MNADECLLSLLYQSAEAGMCETGFLLEINESERMREWLRLRLAQYFVLYKTAGELLNRKGYARAGTDEQKLVHRKMLMNMQVIADKSPARIARILVAEGLAGIIRLKKQLIRHKSAGKDAKELMALLIGLEEINRQEAKEFL